MQKSIIVALLLQATCIYALTPPATPGENLWDLAARIGQELDGEVEVENSFLEVIDSKVDDLASNADNVATCCENVNSGLDVAASTFDVAVSVLEDTSSRIDTVQQIDLVRLESKIDNVASAANQSVSDEFFTTWSLIENVSSTVAVVESTVEHADSVMDGAVSVLDGIVQSTMPALESKVEVISSELDGVASCYDQIQPALAVIESKVDDLAVGVSGLDAVVNVVNSSFLPIIESKIDNLDLNVSVLDSTTSVVDSRVDVVAAKVDALTVSSGSACSAKPITQADITASLGILQIGVTPGFTSPGSYCLAEDVTGAIQILTDDVMLNLNNHTINGVPGDAAITISLAVRVELRNGRTKGRVRIIGSRNVLCEDLQALGTGASGVAIQAEGILFSADTEQVVIRRCMVSSAAAAGILVSAGVENLQIVDSTIQGAGSGIRMDAGLGNASRNIVVQNCVINGSIGTPGSFAGIFVYENLFDIQILDCAITSGLTDGINIAAGCDTVLIKNCVIEKNSFRGIVASPDTVGPVINNLTIDGNTVVGNAGTSGIALSACNNVQVSRNSIRANGTAGGTGNGLLMFDCNTGVIEYNTFVANITRGIYLVSGVSNFSIEHNDLVSNPTLNFDFSGGLAANNVIVANKAHTTSADTGTGTNYTDQTTIPVIQWDRSAAGVTWVNSTPVTEWHNWSSVA